MNRRLPARLIIFPLVILAAAALIWTWESNRTPADNTRVSRFMAVLCQEIAAGRDPTPSLDNTPRLIAETVTKILRPALTEGEPEIAVIAGDAPDADGSATHRAVVRMGGSEVLRLRLVQNGEQIMIIGIRRPP